jgi:hypothetical protein
MELGDLDEEEKTALVGLVKTVVFSDAKVSSDEMAEIDDVVDAIGEDAYQRHLDAFESRFQDEASFRAFLKKTITRQDARELIYGTILRGAAADAIEGGESDLLAWLATAWNIEVTVTD